LKALTTLPQPYRRRSARKFSLPCFLFLTCLFIASVAQAQCNTTLNKLLPASSVNNDDRFGSAIAANGQYMVVAAENSDTLGILYGGAAYVYEKTVAGWAFRAMLTPSHADAYDFFGNKVAIDKSGNTIVIINRNYTNGSAYIFEKPVGGWQTMHETVNIQFPEYLEFNSALDVSDDGSTIVVSNPMSPHGMLYLLQKPVSGWTGAMTPETLVARTGNSGIWLGNDVLIDGDYIYASANNDGNPAIYVYKKNGVNYPLIAKLSTAESGFEFGYHLTIQNNTIAATGISSEPGDTYAESYFLFVKSGEWTDATETVKFQVPQLSSYRYPYPIEFTSPNQLAAAIFIKDGNSYTGKILEITTNDGTWKDISVATLFEERDLSVPPEFANDLVWNGSDLLMIAVRKQLGYAFRYSALSVTKTGGLWTGQQKVSLPRNSSSNVNFGTSIVKTTDALFAGAPYDGTVGRGAGAVYIYNRVGTDFAKVNTIFPSPTKLRATGGSDAAFGSALSVYGDELAVGAPSFLYAPNNYGKIFLYKRISNNWTSAQLYDSLVVPDNLNLNHVGTEVVMNDHVLFASAYNNFNDEHTNAVVVFERVNGKWTYQQLIKLGKPIDKAWPSVKFSLNHDELAVGEFFTINGGVSIINKSLATGKWETTAFISGDTFSGLGSAVKLLDDHLFVGAPGLSYQNVYRSGAVVVFTKLPGQSWRSDIQASALIGAKVPIEGAFFGSSIDVVANTLVVGAPGMFLTFDSQVRTIPGNSYIIQSRDYYWKNTIEYLTLQGDRHASNERDYFGSALTLDQEYFYVGARNENTATGKFSGALYYIPTPPIIFLQPPLCKGAEPIPLTSYPFNGTWTGPGVNTNLGTFDPSLAGEGVHMLKYSTPNCSYEGAVQIEVKAPLSVKQVSPQEVIVCSQEQTTLQLEPISGATYNWYYKQEGADSFVWLAKGSASIVVTNPGDYRAIVSSDCATESPVFKIRLEKLSMSVGPQPIACSSDQSIALVASDNTGVWEGTAVTANQFNPSGLNVGTYKLTYRITTPKGCKIALMDSIRIGRDETFVPNVFTPNGDEKNPVFKVETKSTISYFSIFNRYGEEIHSNAAGEWDGGEAPAGVYFWRLQYKACSRQKELKGWVHLVR
jgi:gliding motility-associated-like protein